MSPLTPGSAGIDPGQFARSVRSGGGPALVLRGPAGQGKTSALERFRTECGLTALHACGAVDGSAQPFGVVQQFLEPVPGAAPMCRELDDSPEVLDSAVVCRKAWSLLRDFSAGQPFLLLVDDAHAADLPSARVIAHVARRAGGHRLGIVLTAGAALPEVLADFPETRLPGIDAHDVRQMAGERAVSPPAATEIARMCRGNPVVAREFVDALSADQLAGRAPLPCEPILGAQSLRTFVPLWSGLPDSAHEWLRVLALGPPSLPVCVRAAENLGLGLESLAAAERANLVQTRDNGIHWPVPWVRESVVQSATVAESARACTALAEVVPADRHPVEHAHCLAGSLRDPDRAAKALAAASVPMARAGMLLRAREAMVRAGELTTDPAERERCRITAAELSWLAGYADHALDLLDQPAAAQSAEARTSEIIMRAVVHGFRESWTTGWRMLPLETTCEPGSPGHAIRLLVTALTAGWESASRQSLLRAAARLRDGADGSEGLVPGVVQPLERLIAGSSDPGEQGRRALRALAWWAQPSDALHPKAWPPRLVPVFLGEEQIYADVFAELLHTEHVRAARSTRAVLLLKLATARTALGQWDQAARTAEEGALLAGELGHHALHAELELALAWIAAARGDEPTCTRHLDTAAAHGRGPAQSAQELWVRGLLALSLGRPAEAFERLRDLHREPPATPHDLVLRRMSTMDAVEAAVLSDNRAAATDLVSEFAGWVRAGAADWAWADLARCRALLDREDRAEQWHRLALQRCGRGWSGARARLAYGFWLRRRRRGQDAREHLRSAREEFARLGSQAWRERAQADLRATGESSDSGGSPQVLTPQERQIAELAAAGHTNRQIAARLALSPRTVGYHLYKVFPKLDITSRTQLPAALRAD
jgi:DNA-binding CsgD family transcriptional regulator